MNENTQSPGSRERSSEQKLQLCLGLELGLKSLVLDLCLQILMYGLRYKSELPQPTSRPTQPSFWGKKIKYQPPWLSHS